MERVHLWGGNDLHARGCCEKGVRVMAPRIEAAQSAGEKRRACAVSL